MYRVDYRDSRERWHSARGLRFVSFAAALAAVVVADSWTAFRVVNVESGTVEYEELVF